MAKPVLKKTAIALGWLALWQMASLIVHRSVLLAGPIESLRALGQMVVTADFWQTAAFTMLRIAGGFLLAFVLALAFGTLAHRFPLTGDILAPLVAAMKSVPVACFVVLLLVWAGSQNLTFIIVFLVAFPILYLNTREGLDRADQMRKQMIDGIQPLPVAAVYSRTIDGARFKKMAGGMMLTTADYCIRLTAYEWFKLTEEILVAIQQLDAARPGPLEE